MGRIALILLAFVRWAVPVGAPQEQGADVMLGVDTTMPGGQAYVPLTLSLTGGLAVGKIVSEVSFPKNVFSFVEAQRGAAGERAEADVATEVRDDRAAGNAVVKVTVTAKKQLPEGVVANLTFQVAGDAKEGPIKLPNVAKAMTLSGEEIKAARSQDGEVTISGSPVPLAGCFFYMH